MTTNLTESELMELINQSRVNYGENTDEKLQAIYDFTGTKEILDAIRMMVEPDQEGKL